jgi:hypothetical protein
VRSSSNIGTGDGECSDDDDDDEGYCYGVVDL